MKTRRCRLNMSPRCNKIENSFHAVDLLPWALSMLQHSANSLMSPFGVHPGFPASDSQVKCFSILRLKLSNKNHSKKTCPFFSKIMRVFLAPLGNPILAYTVGWTLLEDSISSGFPLHLFSLCLSQMKTVENSE